MTTLRSHWLPIAGILLICALAVIFKVGHVGLSSNSDYLSYLSTAQLFSGQHLMVYPQRVLKPLAPLIVAAVAPFTGFPTAFLAEVIFFYLCFALVLYWLAFIFFKDRWLAFCATLLGILSYPILRYGVDLYTETGAQFFYVLSLALTLLYIKMPSHKILILNGLALGIGLLWKEYSLVAGLIFGLVLLFEKVEWQTRTRNLALLALVSLAPTLLVQIWVYFAYHYTYFNWYVVGGASGFVTQFTFHNIVKSIGALLGLAWLFVPFGIWRFPELSSVQQRFLLIALPVPFVALLWGSVSSRLFYVIALAFILLSIVGIARLPKWTQVFIIVLTVLINLAWLVIASAV